MTERKKERREKIKKYRKEQRKKEICFESV